MLKTAFVFLELVKAIAIIFTTMTLSTVHSSDSGCEQGSFRFGPKCYDPHFDCTAPYNNAKDICEEEAGYKLSHFDSTELRQFLSSISIKYQNERFSVKSKMSQCSSISMKSDFKIQKEPCAQSMFYICEYDLGTSKACSVHDNKCYKLVTIQAPANESNVRCYSSGGQLARVQSNDTYEFIKGLVLSDNWWKNITTIRKYNFRDFMHMWSGKLDNEICQTTSYNTVQEANCEAQNYFFCEYDAKDLIILPMALAAQNSAVIVDSKLEVVSILNATSSITTNTNSQPTTAYPTSETSKFPLTTEINPIPEMGIIRIQLQSSNPKDYEFPMRQKKTADVAAQASTVVDLGKLRPFEYAIIGTLGGLFIIITIVAVQLIRIRKRVFRRHYENKGKNRGPHMLPLLDPPSPTRPLLPESLTTSSITQIEDDYETPRTCISPSDDTRDDSPQPIETNKFFNSAVRNNLYGIHYEPPSQAEYEEIMGHYYERVNYDQVCNRNQ